MKTLIINGTIVDGSGIPAYQSNILLKGDRIEKIGDMNIKELIHNETDFTIIDASSLIVSPGFIDTHSHSDLKVLTEPEVLPKVMQGITTEVLGQDGISMAPLPRDFIEPWRKNLAGLDGESDEIDWHYENTENYLKMIEKVKPSINETYLVPHGNIRMEVIGLDNREPNKEEIQKMCEVTRREMEAGCLGLSTGLIYMPCAYSATNEIIELCKVVAEYNGVFVVHQRSEADTILSSMEEIIEIGRKSGVRIHFSHFKVCGKENWDKLDTMFELLDKAKKENIEVSLDQYPYVAGSTMLGVILPPWVHDGGTEKLIERLKNDSLRAKIKEDIQKGIEGWDNFIQFAGVEGIYITSVATKNNEEVIGLSLKELGEKRGRDPLDATFDLLIEEKNAVGMVDFYGTEEHVKRILTREETNVCTDGLLSGKPHPRVYGSFPRILAKYVREENALSMEKAIYKMTYKAAKAMNIKNRGLIKEGYYADLTIFDPKKVMDMGTFVDPIQYPLGIEYVYVNGVLTVHQGNIQRNTDIQRAGRVIRRNEYKES
jgi:N-acyl-D-amino-acid deacylase